MNYTRLEQLEKKHQESMESIRQFLDNEFEEMRAITKWLLETDHNPYSFLPKEWAGSFDNSAGFCSLLHMINHALIDDGEISFPVVYDEPTIIFVDRYEAKVEDIVSETELEISKRLGRDPKIEWLDTVYDFIRERDIYLIKQIRQWFRGDAQREDIGLEYAAKLYRKYKQFDESWVEEAKKDIESGIDLRYNR